MAYFTNNSILENINNLFNFNNPSDIPTDINKNIQLVSEINPKAYPTLNIVKSYTSGGIIVPNPTTLYTTPTDKDFYLYFIQMSLSTSNGTSAIQINAIIGGVATTILNLTYPNTIESTGALNYISVPINPPIKIDKNTAITFYDVPVAGFPHAYNVSASIFGFTQNNIIYNQ